jgi:hypothetical protein
MLTLLRLAHSQKTIAYTLAHAVPELAPAFLNLAFGFVRACARIRIDAAAIARRNCIILKLASV